MSDFVPTHERCYIHKTMESEIQGLKSKIANIEDDISYLKINQTRTDEKINSLTVSIEELKKLINNLADTFDKRMRIIEQKIEAIQMRPFRLWDAAIISLLSLTLGVLLSRFLK